VSEIICLKLRLELCSESFARISGGSLFQNIGPATANAWLPKFQIECVEERHALSAVKIGPIICHSSERVHEAKLLLFICRKSHSGFSLVPKLLTLNG